MAELQKVKASTIRRILAGDAEALVIPIANGDRCFEWGKTPQGSGYWRMQYHRLLNGQDLYPGARAYLENLLVNGRRVCRNCDGQGSWEKNGLTIAFCPYCMGSGRRVKQ